jgi:hypothetical protein
MQAGRLSPVAWAASLGLHSACLFALYPACDLCLLRRSCRTLSTAAARAPRMANVHTPTHSNQLTHDNGTGIMGLRSSARAFRRPLPFQASFPSLSYVDKLRFHNLRDDRLSGAACRCQLYCQIISVYIVLWHGDCRRRAMFRRSL